jgi:hypothetical protein
MNRAKFFHFSLFILVLSSAFSVNKGFHKTFYCKGQTDTPLVKDFSGCIAIEWLNDNEGILLTADGKLIKTHDGGDQWFVTNDLFSSFLDDSFNFIEMDMENFDNGIFFTDHLSLNTHLDVAVLIDGEVTSLKLPLPEEILNSSFFTNLSINGTEPNLFQLDYVGKLADKYYCRLILSDPEFNPDFRGFNRSVILCTIISLDIEEQEIDSLVLKEGNFSYHTNDSWPISRATKFNSTHIISSTQAGELFFISVNNEITNQTINLWDNLPIQDLTFINETHGWLVTREYVYQTSDGAQSWVGVSNRSLFYEMGFNTRFVPDQIYYMDPNTCYLVIKEEYDYEIIRNHILTSTDGGVTFYTGLWPVIYEYKDISFYNIVDLSYRSDGSLWGVDSRLEILLYTTKGSNTWYLYPEIKWDPPDEAAIFMAFFQIFLVGGVVLMIFSSIPELIALLLENFIFKPKKKEKEG